jgi:hypothetical protein
LKGHLHLRGDKVMFAPIWLIAGYAFSAPFEEVKLKAR